MHTANLWHNWSNLTQVVLTGKKVNREKTMQGAKDWTLNFITAMHHIGKSRVKQVLEVIDLGNVKKILDLGGGSGVYLVEFLKKKKDAIGYLFDLPEVIEIAKDFIKDTGVESRINFIAGDYLKDNIGGKYDLIFLSSIIHINSFEENSKLIQKCSDALKYGGRIIIQDFIIDDNRISPLNTVLFSINMLVSTEKGDTYTETEVFTWFKRAKLSNFKRIDIKNQSTLLIAEKV